jgi:hypothetical protein
VYAADSAPAFSLYLFINVRGASSKTVFILLISVEFCTLQALSTAIAFFYSSVLTLPAQLGILTATGICGGASFSFAEWQAKRDKLSSNQPTTKPQEVSTVF